MLRAEVETIQEQLGEHSATPTTVAATKDEEPPPIPQKTLRAESRPETDNLELIYDSAGT